ncbi:MAG TPA: aldose 1-epimerase family protein [Jatrophihabitans sp.]|jgi:aldose 1-epimerase
MTPAAPRHDIAAGPYRAAISEVGAALAGFWRDGRPVTAPHPDDSLPPMSSGAVLLPWPNRIRGGAYSFGGVALQLPLTEPAKSNASHGLVRWVRWSVTEHSDRSLTMTHELVPQTGYPFALRFAVHYALDAVDGLTVRTDVSNAGDAGAPFGAGFHPYLDLNGHDLDHAELQIPAAAVLEVDDRQIPIGRAAVADTPYELEGIRPLGTLRLDHGFADLTGDRAHLRVDGRTTTVWWDSSFRYLQVFTPDLARFGRTAIAIEPMSCPANAFNSGEALTVIAPGDGWSGSWGISAD